MREYPALTFFLPEDHATLIRVGVILTGNAGYDAIRKAQLKAAESKIKVWLSAVKHKIDSIGLRPLKLDVFFSLVDTGTLGRAVLEDDFTYWFKLSSAYLSGKKSIKSPEAVSTFMHEWGHIWLFHQSAIGNEKPLELVKRKLELYRTAYLKDKDKAIRYALSDDDGDELFAYMIQYHDTISKDFRVLLDAALALGR